ncbi:hypothetical protein J3R30DRAFT_3708177 [Lentinula aciculospora]|uniref:Retrotransposon gag domain-containing protein n=1 Tax=Lentinula aciculospora TaxID=153920 RepID=A0A9W9A3I2_9AGAR|nr:hypothetical protein J3R30DRAFT_3708177 [Lentinula aciculospora]
MTEIEIPPSPTTFTLAERMHQQLANTPSPLRGRLPVTTMEIPENIEEVEINKEVGPEKSGNPRDSGGSDPDSPGGPGVPCSSQIPSHSRSPVEWKEINYMLSYLSSSMKEWFKPDILDPNLFMMLAWTSSFVVLVKEWQDNFGIYNAQRKAEDKLGTLRMKESDNIQKYTFCFNTLVVSTNWDLHTLNWAYQYSLASVMTHYM